MSTCVLPEYVVSFRAPTFFRGKKCLILISVRDLVIDYNSIFYVFFHKNLKLLFELGVKTYHPYYLL